MTREEMLAIISNQVTQACPSLVIVRNELNKLGYHLIGDSWNMPDTNFKERWEWRFTFLWLILIAEGFEGEEA